MAVKNRTLIIRICLVGFLLQGLPLQAWGFRSWARKNEVISRIVLNSLSLAAFAGLQYAALKYIPDSEEKFKNNPVKVIFGAMALTGLAAVALIRSVDVFLQPKKPKVICRYYSIFYNYYAVCIGNIAIIANSEHALKERVQKCFPEYRIRFFKPEEQPTEEQPIGNNGFVEDLSDRE